MTPELPNPWPGLQAPTPPEGFRLLTDEEKQRPLPMDAMHLESASPVLWEKSVLRGNILTPFMRKEPYATRDHGPCKTCNGQGEIGGWEGSGNDMFPVGYPCPDCAKPTDQGPQTVEPVRHYDLERRLTTAEKERDHWCDMHTLASKRATAAETELAAVKAKLEELVEGVKTVISSHTNDYIREDLSNLLDAL